MLRSRLFIATSLLPLLMFGTVVLPQASDTGCGLAVTWAAEPARNAPAKADATGPMPDPFADVGTTDHDPYESMNRSTQHFNEELDRKIFEPLARGYNKIMPAPVSRSVTNFFNNLEEPRIVLNGLLQGKFHQAASDTIRFFINTTVGIGGLFDVAKHGNLPRHEEDFGQTLAVWGMKESSYFVIPLLGPSSFRDATGQVVDFFTYPLLYYHDEVVKWSLYGLLLVDRRANLLTATDVLYEAAGEDRYEFMREFYFQIRKNQIYDGNPPLDLPYMIDEDPAGSAAPGATK
jgi:phospholipid-binding lipoprotein MlaA